VINVYANLKTCDAETYSPSGSAARTPCPTGTYSAATSLGTCTPCDADTYSAIRGAWSETACMACPSGKSSPPGSDAVQDCSSVCGEDGSACNGPDVAPSTHVVRMV